MVVVLRSSGPGADSSPDWHWKLAKINLATWITSVLLTLITWLTTRGWSRDMFEFWTTKVLVKALVFPFGTFAVWDFVRSWKKVKEVRTVD